MHIRNVIRHYHRRIIPAVKNGAGIDKTIYQYYYIDNAILIDNLPSGYDREGETAVRISICVGSSCHLKGSREVVELLERLIGQYGVGDRVELAGTFCMGRCQSGVSVLVENTAYSVLPETVEAFFISVVLPAVDGQP